MCVSLPPASVLSSLPLSPDALSPSSLPQWVIDTAQNAYHALASRRDARAQSAYQYAYEPAPAAARPASSQPDYSSGAWKASTVGSTGAPPPPPTKSSSPQPGQHNPLAGGGSLLEDDEDDEEDALAMPGTQGKGAQLV